MQSGCTFTLAHEPPSAQATGLLCGQAGAALEQPGEASFAAVVIQNN
jgi:hypothetical protein